MHYISYRWQLFGQFPKDDDGNTESRLNFDDFINSCLCLFTVLTGENWNDVLYNSMKAAENSWAAIPFVIFFFVFGNYVLVNLFIAVILENFDIQDEEKREKQEALFNQQQFQERKKKRLAHEFLQAEQHKANWQPSQFPTCCSQWRCRCARVGVRKCKRMLVQAHCAYACLCKRIVQAHACASALCTQAFMQACTQSCARVCVRRCV